jgi:hypothetical protein
MFERLQKPFMTVETGEAYQPIRLTYLLHDKNQLLEKLNALSCCEKSNNGSTWNWYWKNECDDLHFESLDTYVKNTQNPIRLGTFTLRDDKLFLNLPSFKRACLAVPFFHRVIDPSIANISHADFINKVFGIEERLPHGFSELFKDDELEKILNQRVSDYEKVLERCEHAETAEEATELLSEFTQAETRKRLPYAERYDFQSTEDNINPDVVFLSFYIYLRGRELVAIRRWFGNTSYSLSDAADETVEKVFGGMDIDLLD